MSSAIMAPFLPPPSIAISCSMMSSSEAFATTLDRERPRWGAGMWVGAARC